MSEHFAAWPPREEWGPLAARVVAFTGWFVLCYGGAAALASHIPWRMSVELPADEWLPFWPGAAALYLTIGPMLMLAPFVYRSGASLQPLFKVLMLETTVAALCFLLLPIDDAPVQVAEHGIAAAIFRIADVMNLHHNNLPSLHVAFACTLALAYAPRASRGGAALLYAWAVAVTLSTLFTRQHFVADVAAGVVLGVACWRLVAYSSASSGAMRSRGSS